jgi:alpha-L-fucosidase 2
MLKSPVLWVFLLLTCHAASTLAAIKKPTTLPAYDGTLAGQTTAPQEPLSLWYRQPAKIWTEALPIGNGRQGVMIFGGIAKEVICLNEDTLWTGGPYEAANPDALAALPQVRQLIRDNKYMEASRLITKSVMGKPLREQAYQPVGEMLLNFPITGEVRDYRRDLNLKTAVARVQFTAGDTIFTREMFAIFPDNILVMRLTADKPGRINFSLELRTDQPDPVIAVKDGQTLVLSGTNDTLQGVPAALKFECDVKIAARGGSVQSNAGGTILEVRDSDSATLYFASATSFRNYNDVTGDAGTLATTLVNQAAAKGFEALLKAHEEDYHKLFDRVTLNLGQDGATPLPTDERIAGFDNSGDPALAALYFQYGRYLLIACSRPGGQPANLQGLWNDLTQPPWDSKFTVNINTEMNYWPVNTANLGECEEPLLAMVEDLSVSGARTAKVMYNARGWVTHHNTDIWRATAPVDGFFSGMWPTGGVWLCNTLYDQYEFNQDPAFLKRLYPLMKGSAEFCLDILVEDPKNHWLVTNPSLSPENRHPFGYVAAGPTMDMQLIRDLFAHCIEAGKVLGVDADLQTQLASTSARLAPNQIGSQGQLQEWLEDWDTMRGVDQHQRHVSHLYGFFPGEDIPFYGDQKLVAAVKKSLQLRGDDATGWGLAWRLNLWDRLHDGPHAYTILRNLLTPSRTAPNLFDLHPPFQIDGNFGGVSGIAEMLLQSTNRTAEKSAEIELLPALPPQWPVGSVEGLRARGGYEIALAWKDGKLTWVTLKNVANAQPAKLRYAGKIVDVNVAPGESRTFDGALD